MATILLNKIRIGGKAPTKIMKGNSEVKVVKKGSTVVYDTLNYYSYSKPSLTLVYPSGNVSASGGTKTPTTRSWSQTYTAVGHSGATYTGGTTNGTITSFSASPTTYGTLTSSTGVYTFNSNSSTSERTVTITGSVTANGQSNSIPVTLKQSGISTYTASIIWSNWENTSENPWGVFNSLDKPYNVGLDSVQIWERSNTLVIRFSPGAALTVNNRSGGTATIASGASAFCFYLNEPLERWYACGTFTHDSSKSYTRYIG